MRALHVHLHGGERAGARVDAERVSDLRVEQQRIAASSTTWCEQYRAYIENLLAQQLTNQIQAATEIQSQLMDGYSSSSDTNDRVTDMWSDYIYDRDDYTTSDGSIGQGADVLRPRVRDGLGRHLRDERLPERADRLAGALYIARWNVKRVDGCGAGPVPAAGGLRRRRARVGYSGERADVEGVRDRVASHGADDRQASTPYH